MPAGAHTRVKARQDSWRRVARKIKTDKIISLTDKITNLMQCAAIAVLRWQHVFKTISGA